MARRNRELRLFIDQRTGDVVAMIKQPDVWGDLIPQLWAEAERIPAAEADIAKLCETVLKWITYTPETQYMEDRDARP